MTETPRKDLLAPNGVLLVASTSAQEAAVETEHANIQSNGIRCRCDDLFATLYSLRSQAQSELDDTREKLVHAEEASATMLKEFRNLQDQLNETERRKEYFCERSEYFKNRAHDLEEKLDSSVQRETCIRNTLEMSSKEYRKLEEEYRELEIASEKKIADVQEKLNILENVAEVEQNKLKLNDLQIKNLRMNLECMAVKYNELEDKTRVERIESQRTIDNLHKNIERADMTISRLTKDLELERAYFDDLRNKSDAEQNVLNAKIATLIMDVDHLSKELDVALVSEANGQKSEAFVNVDSPCQSPPPEATPLRVDNVPEAVPPHERALLIFCEGKKNEQLEKLRAMMNLFERTPGEFGCNSAELDREEGEFLSELFKRSITHYRNSVTIGATRELRKQELNAKKQEIEMERQKLEKELASLEE